MTSLRTPERGEGKIGCFISLLVLLLAGGVAFKLIPVFFSNGSLVNTAEDLGSRAALMPVSAMEQQIRSRAAELEIPEAMAKGAITISLMGDQHSGTCNITLRYTRKIDLYGFYTFDLPTDKTVSRPYMDAR